MAGQAPNSRTSVAGAGWDCASTGFEKRVPRKERNHPFSWLNPIALVQSRNDRVARKFGDPTNDERRAWMRQIYGDSDPDPRVDLGLGADASFLVAGDTGEGDASQWAVVPTLERLDERTDFMIIASDVVYPAGGVNEYENKFYRPYADFLRPIFAVPGNHDWYDGLTGFMFHLCGEEDPPPTARHGPRSLLGQILWRKPQRVDRPAVRRMQALRSRPEQQARQPAPYFVLEAGPLELVCIDTGITNSLDAEQGGWLRGVSASPKPKILVTGKPIYVDGKHDAGAIEGGGTVDEIVRAPEHGYIAAIGGDIHNYQRYPVDVGAGRVVQYLVSGGGGAFMHATHTIPRVALRGVTEKDFRCYPLRGDSLSFYSQAFAHKLRWLRSGRLVAIDPRQASAYMSQRLGIPPAKEDSAIVVTPATRRAAERIFPLPGPNAHGLLQPVFSEFMDWNTPPLFKHVLLVEATERTVRIRCVAATGCVGEAARAPEDDLRAERDDDGHWHWTWPMR